MKDFIPVWELPNPPRLSKAERTVLLAKHGRQDWLFPEVGEAIHLDAPVCTGCGEPWLDGCSTVRALMLLALTEHQRDVAQREAETAQIAAAEVGSLAEWEVRHPDRTWEVRYRMADVVLMHGGPEAVRHGLSRVAEQMIAKAQELWQSRKAPQEASR